MLLSIGMFFVMAGTSINFAYANNRSAEDASTAAKPFRDSRKLK